MKCIYYLYDEEDVLLDIAYSSINAKLKKKELEQRTHSTVYIVPEF